MLIRRETDADAGAVATVHEAAFPTTVERDLAVALRKGATAVSELSLVAEIDGLVVGHVVCSRGDVGGRSALGLGPIGVIPAHQGVGIGSALMHAVIAAADAMHEPAIVLLGDPAYYGRFGFVAAEDRGIDAPDPSWGSYFQVRTLADHDPTFTGPFTYAAPFDT